MRWSAGTLKWFLGDEESETGCSWTVTGNRWLNAVWVTKLKGLSDQISELSVNRLGKDKRIPYQGCVYELFRLWNISGDLQSNSWDEILGFIATTLPRPKKKLPARWECSWEWLRRVSAIVCIIADLPLPNGPFSQRMLSGGLGSLIQVKMSWMTFLRVPGAHLGGGSRSEASCIAAGEAFLRRRLKPVKHVKSYDLYVCDDVTPSSLEVPMFCVFCWRKLPPCIETLPTWSNRTEFCSGW